MPFFQFLSGMCPALSLRSMALIGAANLVAGFGAGYIYALYKHEWKEGENEDSAPNDDAEQSTQIKVTRLYVYPIKACAGVQVDDVRALDKGLENDRMFMLVDFRGRSITQRREPRLALIKPNVEGDVLRIEIADQIMEHAIKKWGTKQVVEHLGQKMEGIDQGDVVAEFVQKFLGAEWNGVRLMRMREGFVRKVNERYSKEGVAAFSDGWPYMIASEEGLKMVEERVGRSIDMMRFRPNVVVEGGGAFAEDGWKRIRVGEGEFNVVKQCVRCKVPTVDLERGVYDEEGQPTVALKQFRRFGATVVFGQNMVPASSRKVSLKVGDVVTVLERKEQVPQPDVEEAVEDNSGKGKEE